MGAPSPHIIPTEGPISVSETDDLFSLIKNDAPFDVCSYGMDKPELPVSDLLEVDNTLTSTPFALDVEYDTTETSIHPVCGTADALSHKYQVCKRNLERVFRGEFVYAFSFLNALIIFLNEDIPATTDARVIINHISIRGVMVLQHLQELEARRLEHTTTCNNIDTSISFTLYEAVHDFTCFMGVLFMYLQFYRSALVMGWIWLRSSSTFMVLPDRYTNALNVALVPTMILSMLLAF